MVPPLSVSLCLAPCGLVPHKSGFSPKWIYWEIPLPPRANFVRGFLFFFCDQRFFFRYYYCLFGLGCLFVYLFSFIVCLSDFDSFFFMFVFLLSFIICFSVGFIFCSIFFCVFSFFSFHPLFSVVIIFYSAIKLKTRGVAADLRRILQPFAKDEIFLFYGQVYEKLVFEILPR